MNASGKWPSAWKRNIRTKCHDWCSDLTVIWRFWSSDIAHKNAHMYDQKGEKRRGGSDIPCSDPATTVHF